MRILVCCTDLGVRVPGTKGASLHLAAIATAFADLGHDVMIAGVAGHGAPPPGVRHRLLPHPGRTEGLAREFRKLRFTDAFPAAVEEAVDAFTPDVVYERLALFGTAGERIARRHGVPHVVEVNALLAAEEAAWRGLRLAGVARARERRALTAAHLRVAVSDEVAAAIAGEAGDVRTLVVPNGVDARMFARMPSPQEARARLGLPPRGALIGFTGSLRPWHGLDVAIEALPHLSPDVRLVVAGDGPVRDGLVDLAARVGVAERVVWLGQVPHAEIPAVLAAVDVAVAPYPRLAGFGFSPLKLVEYMASGTPVVASDIGQIRPLLGDGRLGRLTAPGDPAALARACRAVLASPGRAAATGAAAREVALAEHGWTRRAAAICRAMAGLRSRHALAL